MTRPVTVDIAGVDGWRQGSKPQRSPERSSPRRPVSRSQQLASGFHPQLADLDRLHIPCPPRSLMSVELLEAMLRKR